ncbi:PEGA domain-containing protein [Pseudorhodoplanes sp.]|uniref:PEGA domain-containing protein n=1 Tax=Pseudorhodoplanes sp. TaxID=1934341 RepID=UPI002BEA86DF|nr:PEGA domain-containing protein [Pseudorhodoplanes sp.]HWV55108.1 PEGA domain-containing protein [Pseudorhodoplanes sp.]
MVKQFAIVACGLALAACSSSGELMRTATPTVPLQFESEPPGAEVKTSGGQTCRTPCALAIPAEDFQATFSLTGFQTQTVPVKLLPPEDMRGSEEMGLTGAPPRFSPSPVAIEMQKATPQRRTPAKKPRVAKQPPADAVAEQPAQRTQRATSQQPSTSGFNPPPQNSSGGFGQPQSSPPAGAWPAPQTR